MGPLIISQFVVCGICLAIGLLHLALYARLRSRKADLFFSLMCFLNAAGAFLEALTYRTVELQTYNLLYKLQVSVQGCLWIAMAWFIALLTASTRHWVVKTVSAAYGLAVLINILSPFGILYSTIETLNTVRLPWDEELYFAVGSSNPWRYVADIAWLILLYMVIDSCTQLWRRGERRRALFIGTSLFLCLGPAYLHGSLIDMGLLSPPFLNSYAFLALILVMSSYLVGEIVQASVLTRKLAADERRWRSLLENVNLIVLGVDKGGCVNFVNPFFNRISGFATEDVIGKPLVELFSEGDRQELEERFTKAMRGDIRPHATRALATKTGLSRQVNWFNTVLRDAGNQITGILSIGEDVTELMQAQQALQDEKERMDVILSTLDTGLVLLDTDLNVVWINETLRKMFPEGVPLGSKCYDIAENRSAPCEDCGAVQSLKDGRVHVTERYNASIEKWVNIVSLPISDESGRIVQILEATTDITERKHTEEARDRYLVELETLKARLEDENIYLKEEIEDRQGFKEIVGRSNTILYVLEKVRQVAETDATVLIQGETGVGKELVARAIHNTSRRSQQPFIKVNCAALPANLVESELFGHEAGAFTGADRLRRGRFELADGGTIFLDEISELPLDLQSKLLRVLQEGQFERVGGSNTLKVDTRAIAATNRNLSEEVAEGRFRPDLFYRLNVYPITVPPLRTRREDIPLLVNHFVPQIAIRIGKTVDQIPPNVLEKLTAYDWPGNVRELINILERSVITSPDGVIRLPEEIADSSRPAEKNEVSQIHLVDLKSVERDHIKSVLKAVGWRISGPKGAAKVLGLNPSTLRFRMKKLGISKNS